MVFLALFTFPHFSRLRDTRRYLGSSRGANCGDELAQVSGRERGLFPLLPPRFLNGARANLAHWVFGVLPQHCFPLLAIRIYLPAVFFFPRFAKSRGRLLQWPRVWELRKSKAKACESCLGKATFKGFLQGRNPSPVSSTGEARRGRGRRSETHQHRKELTDSRAISSHPLAKSPPLLSTCSTSPCLSRCL